MTWAAAQSGAFIGAGIPHCVKEDDYYEGTHLRPISRFSFTNRL